jgi:hypothetical protein
MIAKRGYYEIEVDGVKITGHFSVNFWALLEETMGFNSLADAFAFMSKGIGLSQIRMIVFCSERAYSLENGKESLFKNIYQCGAMMEEFTEEHLVAVTTSFAESKLLGSDVNFGIVRNPKSEGESDDTEGKQNPSAGMIL